MPERKCFWTIYVVKDKKKTNSVNKAKIQEYAIGINLFKAVYLRVYISNLTCCFLFIFFLLVLVSPILHEHKLYMKAI